MCKHTQQVVDEIEDEVDDRCRDPGVGGCGLRTEGLWEGKGRAKVEAARATALAEGDTTGRGRRGDTET